ncbi:plant basic secretory protein [Rhizodiscina lignyota]|uniref:Plant basic secretory protein n=1 Tax=Rhizodiscina lignyota TaxID=1504668 RepID=A0A9P4IHG9_9PEZI|nr:plant basic secretory protein [Rhizodiscina lignyota]
MSPAVNKKPHPKAPKPLLRLEVRDLSEEGARAFLSHIDCGTVLEETVNSVHNLLYSSNSQIPGTRSVTLILRSMPGVAYTTGKDIDDDHKEIHFSTDYISGIAKERKKEEMMGVLTHEMVHCWQWNSLNTAPGGLIEGIADWVRLRAGLVPPHWKREMDGDWDAGYQHTGYFLDYLESRFGHGTVMAVNERLREGKYDEEKFWKGLFGCTVKQLWKDYGRSLGKRSEAEQGTLDGWVEGPESKQDSGSV